ncbi:MAG: transporter associated domain-containing protein [Pseudomonadales bacterium]|nr:transporter associated domain-containing protein [Pseudomonadales bacterium]
MSESDSKSEKSRSWLERLSMALTGEPSSRAELLEVLRASEQRELLDAEALSIIEGALTVSDLKAREIMVPRSQVVFFRIDQTAGEILTGVIESGHSRFPVLGDGNDDVLGVLLAKDMLFLAHPDRSERFNLRDLLRRSPGIPESKRLNVLLQEFKANRNHLAVVYDEYGSMSGIITIEDVLEQIVGDIEDEFDYDEDDFIKQHVDGTYTVKALTTIEDFNRAFGSKFDDDEFDTIGGLMMNRIGRLPNRDDQVVIEGFEFRVLNADNRRIHLLQVARRSTD